MNRTKMSRAQPYINFFSLVSIAIATESTHLLGANFAAAEESETQTDSTQESNPSSQNQVQESPSGTTWESIKKKTRVRTFSEFMSPVINGRSNSIPLPDTQSYLPTNLFNIAWMDYEIAQNTRIVYWQRFITFLAGDAQVVGPSLYMRNPRFALRRTNVMAFPGVDMTLDFYFQPGIAQETTVTGKALEVGFRTASTYPIAGSRWTVGMISEFTSAFYKAGKTGSPSDVYGWFLPWGSYELTPFFSTQHWVTVPFQHSRGTELGKWSWDDPSMPYIQNGIGMNLSQSVWASVFLNNYLLTPPTLSNTWLSVWLSLTVL